MILYVPVPPRDAGGAVELKKGFMHGFVCMK